MTSTPIPSPSPAVSSSPRTLSILSLVAAIASVPLGHFIILPVAAIILGFLARSREPWARSFSTWGITLGFILLFWWVLAGLLALMVWLPLAVLHVVH